MRFFLLALALMGGSASIAGTLAMTGTNLITANDANGYTTGWAFSTTGATVTALGFFDAGRDGLLQAHEVGIFATDGKLLVSATVPQGVAGILNGDWRFVSITPFALGAGSYVIGGYKQSGTNDSIVVEGSTAAAPGITLGNLGHYVFGPSFSFPVNTTDIVYLNPNFETGSASAPTPEPATLGLAAGALSLAFFRRRK